MGHDADQDAPFGLSDECRARLDSFADLLVRWNGSVNLVSKSTVADLWQRHVADSLQLLDLAPPTAGHWADLGSGGGFPGLVVAIAAGARFPRLRVTLVDSDQRKAAFLRAAAHLATVELSILGTRIETLSPLRADVVSARALAPMDVLWYYVNRHMAPDGLALLPKGAGYRDELANANLPPDASISLVPSLTAADSVILCIRRGGR